MAKRNLDIYINGRDHASKIFKRIAVAAGAYLSFRAIGGLLKASTQAFIEQEAATMKLKQAYLATGGAAGLTVKEMQAFADELQRTTTYGDEVTETAMSMMLTFKQVKGEVFKDSIRLAQDMSTALGQDMKSSVIQLGKALNDPLKGVTALSRVGVSFSKEQLTQIKQFMAQNDLMSAQKVILDELAGEFGGQAAAAANTFGGSIKQLGNAWGDAKEKLGEYIASAPGFQNAITVATVAIQNFGTVMQIVWTRAALGMVQFWEDTKHLFGTVIPELAQWFGRNWKQVFETIWNFTKSVVVNMSKNLWNFFKAVWGWLKGEGFDFKWTGLLEGFESTLEELPKIAERKIGPLEAALAEELAGHRAELAKKIEDRFAEKARAGQYQPRGGGGGGGTEAVEKRNQLAAVESRTRLGAARQSAAEKATVETERNTRRTAEAIENLTFAMINSMNNKTPDKQRTFRRV